jgi:hypothetical protein
MAHAPRHLANTSLTVLSTIPTMLILAGEAMRAFTGSAGRGVSRAESEYLWLVGQ